MAMPRCLAGMALGQRRVPERAYVPLLGTKKPNMAKLTAVNVAAAGDVLGFPELRGPAAGER